MDNLLTGEERTRGSRCEQRVRLKENGSFYLKSERDNWNHNVERVLGESDTPKTYHKQNGHEAGSETSGRWASVNKWETRVMLKDKYY